MYSFNPFPTMNYLSVWGLGFSLYKLRGLGWEGLGFRFLTLNTKPYTLNTIP